MKSGEICMMFYYAGLLFEAIHLTCVLVWFLKMKMIR